MKLIFATALLTLFSISSFGQKTDGPTSCIRTLEIIGDTAFVYIDFHFHDYEPGPMRITEIIPEGMHAFGIDTKGGKAAQKDHSFHIVYFSGPSDADFMISYGIKLNEINLEKVRLSGFLSYMHENERIKIRIE